MTDLAATQQQPRVERVIEKTDPRWVRLHEIIESQSLKRGDFILSSGRSSKYLFQLRQTTMSPEGAALIGDIIVDYMNRVGLSCIGGLEMGAVPVVCAVSVMSFVKGSPKNAFFVRKAAKEHGARERIDGYVHDGAETLIIDDVATSGGSILKAIDGLKEESVNCSIAKALVIVDRQEGASENLARSGIELVSIFKKEDFDI
ncbi:MAG: orotate phosphoribosyltransferase [Alphaproteobacteria bacterium]|nr:orotate phosphoribosyltransferase [Alphaproteobacteria bacterium]MBM3651711.1 orotate phosphoribosyltransferase [Alphaproteobacteria bacterium]